MADNSMPAVDSLKDAVRSLLSLPESAKQEEKALFQQACSNIVEKLTDASTTQPAFDRALQAGTEKASPALLKRIQFFADVYQVASGDATLIAYIFKQQPAGFADIARTLYHTPEISLIVGQDKVQALRSYLFRYQPTAVLLGLVERGTIKLATAIKRTVIEVLSYAVQDGFDISQDSTRSLLNRFPYPDSTTPKTKSLVGEAVKKIQRLQALVRDPEHVGLLIAADYESAASIANTELATFRAEMAKKKMAQDVAERIHDHATTVQIRNEQTWALALSTRNNSILPRVIATKVNISPDLYAEGHRPGAKKRINLTTLFEDMDTVACTECSSVLSPSAYFVDLLRLLQETKTISSGETVDPPTLFAKLMGRRPDLQHLKLSCANTNSTVPYLDLVTEILESFISNLSSTGAVDGPTAIQGFDAPAIDADGTCTSQPRNTNYDVYNRVVAREVYPMQTFPYSLSMNTIRELLSAAGTSRYECIGVFSSADRVMPSLKPIGEKRWNSVDFDRLKPVVASITERSRAAEYLGLDQEDFMAICRESFQPLEFWQARNKGIGNVISLEEYRTSMGVSSAAELWGFAPEDGQTATQCMLDEVNGKGLTFVKSQLLGRADLNMQDLQDILKTQFMGRRLIITTGKVSTDGKKPVFTGKLSDLRMRMSTLGSRQSSTLTEDVCHDLQAFIRLWRKLPGWSISDLDTILSTLKRKSCGPISGISAGMLLDLAAAKHLADETKVPPGELQVLWGDIDTNGTDCLYAKVFLVPRVVRLDPIFEADKDGNFLASRENLSQHRASLLSTLQTLDADFPSILSASSFTGEDNVEKSLNGESEMTISNLSLLYRTSLICRILEIKPAQLNGFRRLFPELDVFGGPRQTLAAVERYTSLRKTGWTIEDVLLATQIEIGSNFEEMALAACSKIASAKLEIELKDRTAHNDDVGADAELKRILPLLFDATSARNVVRLFDGTMTTHKEVVFSNLEHKDIKVPEKSASKLSCISFDNGKKCQITVTGLLSQDELDAALAIVKTDAEWNSTISYLHQKSQSVFDLICRQLQLDEAGIAEARTCFLSAEESATSLRKAFFIEKALPKVNAQLLRQTIIQTVSGSFPIPAAPLAALLGDFVFHKPAGGVAAISAYEALRSIKLHDATEKSFEGYFCPPASGKFQFFIDDSSTTEEPQLSVNGIKLVFKNTLGVWKSDLLETGFISGKYYSFSFLGNIEKQVKYTTQDSLTPSELRSDMFVSLKSRDVALTVYRKLAAACKVVFRENISLSEMEYFNNTRLADFNGITFRQVERINAYRKVRDSTAKADSEYTLIQFLSWVSSPGATFKEAMTKISLATGWPAKQVENILSYKYPAKKGEDRLALFYDEKELSSINQILKLMSKVNLQTVETIDYFRLAGPGEVRAVAEDMEKAKLKATASVNSDSKADSTEGTQLCTSEIDGIAASFRLATQSSGTNNSTSPAVTEASNRLRETQRTVLIQYLLNHKKVKNELDIQDADDLFQHFLIDVKMGAKLQTSRMRQAISTVQLFVQRCSLGLESIKIPGDPTATPPKPEREVKCNSVSAVRWKYMSKFTLWVAHRKLFLYPENWIDPTLRDNKTEAFKALEGALSQNNLNPETISTAIKAYIYQINEISDLEVLAYAQQRVDTATSKFHIFAKTRQAPFQYYYRFVDVQSVKDGDLRWAAWTKVDVEIPSIESDIDGNPLEIAGAHVIPAILRGRLFLFIPQFMVQNRPQPPPSEPFAKLAESSPQAVASKKYWEMKLGWTEYRNGKWTSKQTSQASLKFPNIKAPHVPPLSSLRFFVSGASSTGSALTADHDTLYIDVQSWYQMETNSPDYLLPTGFVTANKTASDYKATKQWPLGRFRIRGNRVDAIAPNVGDSWDSAPANSTDLDQKAMVIRNADHSVPTTFSKLWAKSVEFTKADEAGPAKGTKITVHTQQSSEPDIIQGSDNNFLLLARRGIDSKIEQDYTWTASFDQTQSKSPSALVLQVSDRLKSETFFAIPAANSTDHTSSNVHLFNHPNISDIMERTTMYDDVQSVYKYLDTISDTSLQNNIYGKIDSEYNEQSKPYSIYTWELCMHAVSLVMERCAAAQQYELALEVARLVFDPSADSSENKNVTRCWQFQPFRKIAATESISDILRNLAPGNVASTGSQKIDEWKNNPFSPHSVARGRPNVYMKRFVLKYIEILVAAGDELFRQNSLESVPLAIQRYVEASHLYGPVGKSMPKMGELPVKTFHELSGYIDSFSNAVVDMELDFPYSCEPCYRGAVNTDLVNNPEAATTNKYAGIVQAGYFCLPPNTKLTEIRNLIDDRLFKIRNCLDINGNAISLALFDPPLDPAVITQAVAANLSASVLLNDLDTPMPNYRFYYLLQKALEMCSELKVLGDQFLSAKEKKDSEALTMLLSRNEILSNTTQLSIKELQKTEALKSIFALEEARKGSAMRLSFYLALTGESQDKIPDADSKWTDIQQSIEKPTSDDLRMTSYEKREMEKSDSAAELSEKASALELTAGALMAMPNLLSNMQPMGVGVGIKMDAENIAKLLQCTASALNLRGQMDLHDAQRASRKGAMIRQLQERRLQANIAGWEVKKIDKDIAVQRVRLALAESEIRAQQQQIERAQEVQEWHRTKYTNATLYAWLENSFRTLYHRTFLLAMQLARKAERSFQFEMAGRLGATNKSFLAPGGYWDSARDGLLSASNLYLGLKKLEAAYMEKRPHDYEITKNISLRQIDPVALFSLRQTGSASFSLHEVLFDMDFPGHYFRRIKSIGISIPAIVGPYTGLNCLLSLTEHRIRVTPTPASSSESYTYKGRDDTRFQSDTIPISSIAVSNGTSDAGVFELSFSGERFLPFEGAGCYSKWTLEFPAAYRQFDYNTIADVILHVRYTAVEGGQAMRQAANKSVEEYIGALHASEAAFIGPTALLDLKNDFPNEWYTFMDKSSQLHVFKLTGLANRLPFFTRGSDCKVKGIVVYVCKRAGTSGSAIELMKPQKHTLEQDNRPASQIDKNVAIFSKSQLSCDINADWEIQIKQEEDLQNVLVLLQYEVAEMGGKEGDKP